MIKICGFSHASIAGKEIRIKAFIIHTGAFLCFLFCAALAQGVSVYAAQLLFFLQCINTPSHMVAAWRCFAARNTFSRQFQPSWREGERAALVK